MGAQRIKNPFTLIEVAFAIFLSPFLLIPLFEMTTLLLKTNQHLERAYLTAISKLLIQERLSTLLSSIELDTLATPKNQALTFYTKDLLDPDPAYSGTVPVKLYLNDQTLTLQLRDRKEILLEGVSSLSIKKINGKSDHPSSLSFLRLTLTPASSEPSFRFAFFFNDTQIK